MKDYTTIPCGCRGYMGKPCGKVFIQHFPPEGRFDPDEADRVIASLTLFDLTIEKVAKQFCILLRSEIGEEQANLAAKLNSAETNVGVCHSHDFCDANMVMDAAMSACGLSMDWDSEEGMPLYLNQIFNTAWDTAKAAGFVASAVSV